MTDPSDSPSSTSSTATKSLSRDKGRATAREQLGADLQADPVITVGTPKSANFRHRRVGWTSFVIVQLLMLFFVISLVPRKGDTQAHTSAPVAVPAPVPAPLPTPASAAAPATSADTLALQTKLSKAQDQIIALQKQIDSQREDRDRTKATLQEMSDRMALLVKQSSYVPGGTQQNLSVSDASQVASMVPSVTPAMSELVLLKERNRLTDYADKAITTGSREGLQAIVETMFNQHSKNMHHAAGAEFRRVAAYFEIASNIDPNYRLPIQELFKDQDKAKDNDKGKGQERDKGKGEGESAAKEGGIRAEIDLTTAQLIQLMHDHQQPWEVRLRCAYLLRGKPDPAINAALLKTLHDDPSLDVVKQAQTSFETRVGQRFRLFDLPSIDAWWSTQTKK